MTAMRRGRLRLIALAIGWFVAAPTLGACAGSGLWINGNDTGGIIPWSPENELVAMQAAAGHCARFGKYARITSIHPFYGDYIAFACALDPPVVIDRNVVLRSRG
jgi:hypothetical protein